MNPLLHPIWWYRISKAIGRNDHEQVVELSMSALRRHPNNLAALGLAVTHLDAMGQAELAKVYARKSLAIDPDNFDLHEFMIRNLNPTTDKAEIVEHVKWVISIAETTLPKGDLEMDDHISGFERVPFLRQAVPLARQDFAENRQGQAAFYRWAKNYLASQGG